MGARSIRIHAAAPRKPAIGSACNGCGLCCLWQPCPLGIVLSLRWQGRCRVLRWDAAAERYRCGAADSRHGLVAALAHRWIAAGQGCDSDAEELD